MRFDDGYNEQETRFVQSHKQKVFGQISPVYILRNRSSSNEKLFYFISQLKSESRVLIIHLINDFGDVMFLLICQISYGDRCK